MKTEQLIAPASRSVGYYLRPDHIPRLLWQHGHLIRQLIRRNVAARYRGSVLGIFWAILVPLVMLAVYTFVFSVVFQARWSTTRSPAPVAAPPTPAVSPATPPTPTAPASLQTRAAAPSALASKTEFALTLFCGLLLFNVFAETIAAAPGLVVDRVSFVKKVVFPLETLPVVALGTALFNGLISFAILLAGMLLCGLPLSATAGYFPLVLVPLVCVCLGLGWLLSSVGVYLRDVTQLVSVLLQMLMFLTPIFYSLEHVPPAFRTAMRLNPLTVIVENARRTVMGGTGPDWLWLGAVTAGGLVVMQLGYVWFMKTRRGFADVL